MSNKVQLTFASQILNQTNLKHEIKLHERLRKLRENKNLTMDQVSKLIDIKRQTYNGYEAAPDKTYHRSPSFENLVKLADLFNVSTDYLIGLTDNPAPHAAAVDVFSALDSYESMDKNTRQYIAAMLRKVVEEYTVQAV